MRRNWDTIRAVLLYAEDLPISRIQPFELRPGDCQAEHHVQMLIAAGFLVHKRPVSAGQPDVASLSWAGFELLDAIRDDQVWAVCQRLIEANSGGAPTDLLLSAAYFAIRENIDERCADPKGARSADQ